MRLIYKTLLFLSMLLAGAVPALHAKTLSDSGELLDRVVALVDEGVVLQSQLDEQVKMITMQLRERGTRMPPEEVLREQVLENLIVQEVQMQRAERMGISIGDEQLNLALAQVAQRDVMAKIAVSDREIDRWLEQYEATRGSQLDYDISQILLALPQDPTREQLAEIERRAGEIRTRLAQGADFAELAVAESDGQQALSGGRLGWRRGSRLPPQFSDAIQSLDAGEFSEPVRSNSGFHIFLVNDVRGGDDKVVQVQTKARHILLKTNEVLDDATVRARLEEFRERVLAGESFDDIARLESEDPGSAARGGALGWNPPGTFVPQFEKVLAALEPGEISEPFQSPFGWHIILLEDRAERDTTDELKRRRAVEAIRQSKLEQETELWLRQLRDEAWVEMRGS